jgi:hypothetical protein
MNTNKILLAGLVGGVVAFILGFLAYGVLLVDFFESNVGSASGVAREMDDMQWVPMILGHLSLGFLFSVIYGRWANISTFTTGAKAGAVIGFLMDFGINMINYGSTNISTLNGTIADVVVTTIMMALIGGVVAWVLGRGKSPS